MSWAGISSNQTVSCNNLQDAANTGVFTLKVPFIPESTKQVTKTEAASYVNLNILYAPFAEKDSNELVVKSNLQPARNGIEITCNGISTSLNSGPFSACNSTFFAPLYVESLPIQVVTQLYNDQSLNNPFTFGNPPGTYYTGIDGNPYRIDPTGIITAIETCGLATINIATNNSLDIALNISSITVNGVGVTNVSGVDPNTPGNGGSVSTNQIGTYNITMTYNSSTPGQHIELLDSMFFNHCNPTSTGFNSMTFYGVEINISSDLVLTCLDGACP
jgi:hypothetical protein